MSNQTDPPRGSLILSGQARIPKDLSENQMIQVIVELDEAGGTVKNVSVNPSPPVVQNFLRKIMVGTQLENGFGDLLETVEKRLNHRSKMGILTALKDLVRQFQEAKTSDAPLPARRLDEFKW